MSQDDLAERLDAVERRLDAAYPEGNAAAAADEQITDRVESFADRLADLEAAVEAVEGYVGEIERVDEELERRADAALATADGLEESIDAVETRVDAIDERLAADRQHSADLEDRLDEQSAAVEALHTDLDRLDERIAEAGSSEPGRVGGPGGRHTHADGSPRDGAHSDGTDPSEGLGRSGITDPSGATTREGNPTRFEFDDGPGSVGEEPGEFEEPHRDDDWCTCEESDPTQSGSTGAHGTEPDRFGDGPAATSNHADHSHEPTSRGRSAPDGGVERAANGSVPLGGSDPEQGRSDAAGVGLTSGGGDRSRAGGGDRPAVSGWSGSGGTAPAEREAHPGTEPPTDDSARPDRSPAAKSNPQTDANSETLLDRLRSML